MPKRPRSHVIGDRAAAEVARLITQAGFAVEPVRNDYGEDLLVQIAHADRMDATRLWLQVKGTERIERYRRRDGRCSLTVSYEHAIRWIRSADLVVVVLWDVTGGRGWWTWPTHQVMEWQFSETGRQSTTFTFEPENELTVEAIHALGWNARFHHYRRLVLNARDIDDEVGSAIEQEVHLFTAAVMLDFLTLLEIAEKRPGPPETFRIRPEVRVRHEALEREAAAEASDSPSIRAFLKAGLDLVVEQVDRVTCDRAALPRNLYLETVGATLTLMKGGWADQLTGAVGRSA